MVLIKPVDTGFFPFEYLNEEIHKLSASDGPVFLMILFGFILFPFVYRLGYKLRYKRKTFEYILFGIGIFLFLFEIFKQITYAKMYHYLPSQENFGHYYWKILPLQLCSMHIYLAPLIPFIKNNKIKQDITLFIGLYAFIGGIAVLVGGLDLVLGGFQLSDGRWFGDWGLVVHTIVWHVILMNLGALVFGYYRIGDLKPHHIKTIVIRPWLICFAMLLVVQVLNVIIPKLLNYNEWVEGFNLWNVGWTYGFQLPILSKVFVTEPIWIGGVISTFIYGFALLLGAYLVLFVIIFIRNLSSKLNKVVVYTKDTTY